MQSLGWYLNRVRSMSVGEIAWRLQSAARDFVDRPRFAMGLVPSASSSGADREFTSPFRLTDFAVASLPQALAHGRTALVEEAEAIAAHRLTFFDLKDCHLGDPIRWNQDHSAGIESSMGFAPAVDYRDFKRNGDCKLVWEPSRHHQFVTLARAYRVTGDQRFATALRSQLESWLRDCPFGHGMNWRSPLELAIRAINWVWAYDFALESEILDGEFGARVRHSVYLHLWEISRRYSKASSANNHTIGEAAGVYIAATYFHTLAGANQMRAEAKQILEREIVAQTFSGGVNREQAFSYHCFVLQFFLLCGLIGRKSGDEFSSGYWSVIEQELDFVAAICAGGNPPMYGDCDDARVLGLGGDHRDTATLLAIGSVLFQRADWKSIAGDWTEPAEWLLGRDGAKCFHSLPSQPQRLTSKSYEDAGLVLLQDGTAESGISIVFDCGPLGFGSIAAHGHADALSFTLRVAGEDVLVDPGTYDYFTYPEWRDYFRSTAAHNTVEIDGVDQSVMLGKFLWGERAQSCLEEFAVDARGGKVRASHDGYARLSQPVTHKRELRLDGEHRAVSISDALTGAGEHSAKAFFHFAPTCQLELNGHTALVRTTQGTELTLVFDDRFEVSMLRGSYSPKAGWFSDAYHHKTPASTLIACAQWRDDFKATTQISVTKLTASKDRTELALAAEH